MAKVAVVTGGASGIGRAVAAYFARHGDYAHVALLDVSAAAGAAAADALSAAPSTAAVFYVPCDVASWPSQAAAFAAVRARCGRIDVVVANAGISEQGQSSFVRAATDDDDEPQEPSLRALDVNLQGVLYTVKLAVHYIRKNASSAGSRGSILCTASNAGIYPFPTAPIYAASKFAVVGFVRSMQAPLARCQIQINALAPAVLVTNIVPQQSMYDKMIITPMETLVRGVDQILADPSISGGVAEIHGQSVTFRPPYDFVDADTKANLDVFWSLGLS